MNSFTIATFNIYKNDGDFPNRIYQLSQEINKHEINILCLQEDYESENFSSSDVINKELEFYKSSIQTRKKERNGVISSSNLTILSKIKPSKIENIYFDEVLNEQRAVLFCEFEINNKKILVANTHLCHLESKNRLFQVQEIVKYIKNTNIKNVLLCGDLNSTPESNEIKFLKENGFCYNNDKITASRGKIIDYINFYGKLKSTKSDIVLKEYSDHYCLMNTIKL
jgi:endonuclease/exonuclease/phosphatase family metal-dependent hydrolase